MIIRLLGTGAAPNSTSLTRPYWYDLEAPRRNPRKRPAPGAVGTMKRAPLASYFFLALIVSRAFATKASNRGSL
jgi:hypothetical protein